MRLGRTGRLRGRTTKFQSQTSIFLTQPISNFKSPIPDYRRLATSDWRLAIGDWRLAILWRRCLLSSPVGHPINWFDQVRLGLTAHQKCHYRAVFRAPATPPFPNTTHSRRLFGGLCQRPSGGICRLEVRYNNQWREVKREVRDTCPGLPPSFWHGLGAGANLEFELVSNQRPKPENQTNEFRTSAESRLQPAG